MPHGFFGLGWGEVVSLLTLIVVVFNLARTGIVNTAHDSNRKDFEDLNQKLTDFKINVNRLTQLLQTLNRDLSTLSKRVDRHDDDIDKIQIDIAKIKERLGIDDDKK